MLSIIDMVFDEFPKTLITNPGFSEIRNDFIYIYDLVLITFLIFSFMGGFCRKNTGKCWKWSLVRVLEKIGAGINPTPRRCGKS